MKDEQRKSSEWYYVQSETADEGEEEGPYQRYFQTVAARLWKRHSQQRQDAKRKVRKARKRADERGRRKIPRKF